MTNTMALELFLGVIKDGDGHGWEQEIGNLICHHGAKLRELRDDIRANGILEPIHIGSDGRCWDGHHRVAVAVLLGFESVPVNDERPRP